MSSFRFLFMDDAILVGQPQEQLCLGKADRPISPLAYLASLTVKLSNDASFWGQTQDRQSTLMLMNLPIFDRFKPKVMGQRGNVQIWPIHLPKAKTGKTKHSILRNTNRQTCQPPVQRNEDTLHFTMENVHQCRCLVCNGCLHRWQGRLCDNETNVNLFCFKLVVSGCN